MKAHPRWIAPPCPLATLARFAPFFLVAVVFLAGCAQTEMAPGVSVLPTDPSTARSPDDAVRPGTPGDPDAPVRFANYTVAQGDTLWAIAQRFELDHWNEILEANPGVEPEHLGVGQTLRIPVRDADAPPSADKGRAEEPQEPPARRPARPDPERRPPVAATPHVRRGVAEARFVWPARGRVVCRFGEKIPWEPVLVCRGVIIQVPPGTQIQAAKSGVAFVMQRLPGLGMTVSVDHGDGSATTYGYNSEILVRHGEFVRQGDAIAVAGQAGQADGTHVYFRVDRPQGPVDPLPLLPR